jgi:hypothetical protein
MFHQFNIPHLITPEYYVTRINYEASNYLTAFIALSFSLPYA